MLIYLTDSLITEDRIKMDGIKRCVNKLCEAFEESKHLLMGDYDVLIWLKERLKDEIPQIVLNRLINEYAFLTIPSEITEYAKIGDWDQKEIVEKDGSIIHMMPYSLISDSQHCNRTNIIGEDLTDVEFYAQILKWYTRSSYFNYCFKPVHGGGENIGSTFKTTIESEKFVIVIVDIDIKFPGDKPKKGTTWDSCKKAFNSMKGNAVTRLVELEVREIENLLPFNLITTQFEWNRINLNTFRELMASDNDGDILKYFDVKNGIKKKEELLKEDKYRNFAALCYSKSTYHSSICEFNKVLENAKNGDIILPGLGSPLKKVIQYFNDNDICTTIFDLRSYQELEWNKIGKHLLNFCIARPKESMN